MGIARGTLASLGNRRQISISRMHSLYTHRNRDFRLASATAATDSPDGTRGKETGGPELPMPFRIIACLGSALIVACTMPSEKSSQKEQMELAARCQFQACECQVDGAGRGTPPQPVLWRIDGDPYCADGQTLALSKVKPEKTSPAAIMLPDFDDAEDQRRQKNPYGAQ